VLFTPITLENHAPECGGRRPAWIDEALANNDPLSRRYHLAQLADHYTDPEVRYVHLLDGGISDNLALRGTLNTVGVAGARLDVVRILGFDRVRRVIVISAAGESAQDTRWSGQRSVGGIFQIIGMVSGTQIDQYNFETLQLTERVVNEVVRAIREARCAEAPTIDGQFCDDVEGYFVHLSLQDIPNPTVRRHLETIPTSLTIDDRSLEMLIRYGREVVLSSPDLLQLRDGL
jgi:NTE family protein